MTYGLIRDRILALCIALLAGAAFLTGAGTADAEEYRLKLHTYTPMGVPPMKHMLQPWVQDLAEKSNDRLKIDIYPMMQLGGRMPQLVDQAKDGVVDIVWTLVGATPGRFPRTEVFELPFVHVNSTVSNLALRKMLETELADDYTDYHVLLLHVHAGNAIHMKNQPINSFEDFAIKKIRSPGQMSSNFLTAIGATPIATTLTDISSMMARGVLDGTMLPFDVLPAIKLNSLVKYHVLMADDRRPTTAVFMLAMNKKSYESLPADLRKLLDDTTGEAMSRQAAEVMDRFDKLGMKAAKESGAEFITLSADETAKVKAAAKTVFDDWAMKAKATGADPEALLARVRELEAQFLSKQ